MINLQTMEKELQQLKVLIEDRIHHTFLLEHIQKPAINEYKLFFLNNILNKTSLAPNIKEQYIISTMLVQIALDIHQKIPDYGVEENIAIETDSQLSILAGDYYSGLYYLLLSEIEEHQFITVLATAIKDINELKMRLYYLEDESIEVYFKLIKQIDSILIKYVAEFFQMTNEVPVIEELLLASYLIEQETLTIAEDITMLQEIQINKTKGVIDELPEGFALFKQETAQLLESLIYKIPLGRRNSNAR
ncbi:heptaprenyl diphosphate synthase component 1 [Ornithinibacillus xuwenensis]|uniref:Heptaprenyl diphosphate synthase component 1 n=1 Tax=Ornithinibacillus xuwenensis TaxID=3144668 RepID=A0ABU9XD32_9BACI